MIIPFLGIINGLLVPVLLVPPYLLSMSGQGTAVYQFIAYGVVFLLLALFYVRGQKWRSWFYENMRCRRLRKSEKCLLWSIGLLMMVFSNEIAVQLTADRGNAQLADGTYGYRLVSFIGISSMAAFIMTITECGAGDGGISS